MKNRIWELRQRMGLTQEKLGELVGATRQAIHAIETEKYEPSIWLAYDISRVLGYSIEEIFLFEKSERKSRTERRKKADGSQADTNGRGCDFAKTV